MMNYQIRQLTVDDGPQTWPLRLRSLQEDPSAYGSAYEDELAIGLEAWTARYLAPAHIACFGAFSDGGQLLGMNALIANTGVKLRHRAMIAAMYTLPEWRGHGIGAALVKAAIVQARSWPGLIDITLAVTVGNNSAKGLYEKLGFHVYSYDPRFIRVGEKYFDIEWMILSLSPYTDDRYEN
jgi:GNAT superfamily N-acetyltransferase